MILAFPAFRRGHFKVTGSVIDTALTRGHEVRLLWNGGPQKPGEFVYPSELKARWPQAILVAGQVTIAEGSPGPVDAVIGPSLHAMSGLPEGPHYSLDYAWEQITTPARAMAPGGIHLCFVSEYQRAMYSRLTYRLDNITTGFHPLERRQHVTGSTMLDAFDAVRPSEVRARYCLPHGQPVVLFMALKFGVPHAWRRWWYRYNGYHRLVRVVRRYCDDAGALLVVKTREKNLDPWFLRRYADRYVADEDLWPYTSAQLMSVANLCVHFQSGAAIEAARAGVPQLSVRIPHPHLAGYPGHAEVYEWTPGMQAWPGIAVGVSHGYAPHWLASGFPALADVPRVMTEARACWPIEGPSYLDRFCGPPNAAERVLDLVERGGGG